MSPLERLLAEAIPDGTFGGARPTGVSTPPALQAQHRRDLESALDGWEYRRETRPAQTTRHLHPIPDAA
ncbi:hypothetical protein [Streptomyces sp. NBC_00306]|uniref:hypothetical protein n=1 Tax=Streptomyces sp. NBC_00306 TaxID=2975708 RepID=UPI002E2C738F|nr:hypothetical protein [Streptomyces sp. NBC_00306]